MKSGVQKEIDSLKGMVEAWFRFYLACADGHKYDLIHVEEFDEVVEQQLAPYLQRLVECKHIDRKELGEIYTWLGEKHQELIEGIRGVEKKVEVLPCPFCRTEVLENDVYMDENGIEWVLCSSCEATATKEKWNDR